MWCDPKPGKKTTGEWSSGGSAGSNFKNSETLIPPDVSTNNKRLPQPTRGADNLEFPLNEVGIGLVSVQVCDEVLPSIAPIMMHVLEFWGDSPLRYHRKFCEIIHVVTQ